MLHILCNNIGQVQSSNPSHHTVAYLQVLPAGCPLSPFTIRLKSAATTVYSLSFVYIDPFPHTHPTSNSPHIPNFLPYIINISSNSYKMSFPQTCKAATAHNVKTKLVIKNVPGSAPKEGEILIKVDACGVCHSEHAVLEGHFGPL